MVEIPDNVFHDAVRAFWSTRAAQAEQQRLRGVSDQGNRGSVTGGAQLNGFVRTIADVLVHSGVKPVDIHVSRDTATLPGYFRPLKTWDLIVTARRRLIAAVELKSQSGSFGNNFNNRVEEALGTAVDTWTAFREGGYGETIAPWLGYLLVLEDAPESRRSKRPRDARFGVRPEFADASYAQRYEQFCLKLVRERQYNGAALILTAHSDADTERNYSEPNENLSGSLFLRQLVGHVLGTI